MKLYSGTLFNLFCVIYFIIRPILDKILLTPSRSSFLLTYYFSTEERNFHIAGMYIALVSSCCKSYVCVRNLTFVLQPQELVSKKLPYKEVVALWKTQDSFIGFVWWFAYNPERWKGDGNRWPVPSSSGMKGETIILKARLQQKIKDARIRF